MRLRALLIVCCLVGPAHAASDDAAWRVLVVRERATTELLDGTFSLKVLKLMGYSVRVRVDDEVRTLKLGARVAPAGAQCEVVFEEISPETRIARFATNCP